MTVDSGTSFSAPLVAGTAGLMYSVNKAMNVTYAREILERTATDLNKTGFDIYTGYGLLNTSLAVQTAMDNIRPSVSYNATKELNNTYSVVITASDNVGLQRILITTVNSSYNTVVLLSKYFQGMGVKSFTFNDSGLSLTSDTVLTIVIEDLAGNSLVATQNFTTTTTTTSSGFLFYSFILMILPVAILKRKKKII